jgi:hypothetical protein
MTTEIAKTDLPTIDPFQKFADETASRAHIVGQLLRFTKHGEYKCGQDQDEVAEGTRMLAYLPGLKYGWVKWNEGQPVRHLIGLIAEGFEPPPREELGDLDESTWNELNGRPIDPWQKTNYLVMLDEEGELYTFVTSSKGGLSAIGQVADSYAKRRRMKPDEIPVIELHARSYQHKDFGETFAPSFKIVAWASIPANFNELESAMEADKDESTVAEERIEKPKPTVKAKTPVKAIAGKKKNGPSKTVRF